VEKIGMGWKVKPEVFYIMNKLLPDGILHMEVDSMGIFQETIKDLDTSTIIIH